MKAFTRRLLYILALVSLTLVLVVYSEVKSLDKAGLFSLDERSSRVVHALGDFVRGKHSLPPLESIIDQHGNITGDPQILLDFAIIGFGKCGTTTLMDTLKQHPELQVLRYEQYMLMQRRPDEFIRRLHKVLTKNLMRGYKNPTDIREQHILDYYRTLWPKTKLLIGIRNPIALFRSLYNFRVQNYPKGEDEMLHPNQLIGTCFKSSKHCCTFKADFAYDLMKLGKQHYNGTRPTTELEQAILKGRRRAKVFNPEDIPYMPNEVFLFDLEQMADKNDTRRATLRSDIQKFLGLETELVDFPSIAPGRQWNVNLQAKKDAMKIKDICEDQYIPVRKELLRLARTSSEWIRTSFLDLPGVHVSSRPFFEQILESYMQDPCGPKIDSMTDEEVEAILQKTREKYFITPL